MSDPVSSLNVGECIRGVFFISLPRNELAFTISSYDGFIGNVANDLVYLTSSILKLHFLSNFMRNL
jgi:hypothetical protein